MQIILLRHFDETDFGNQRNIQDKWKIWEKDGMLQAEQKELLENKEVEYKESVEKMSSRV